MNLDTATRKCGGSQRTVTHPGRKRFSQMRIAGMAGLCLKTSCASQVWTLVNSNFPRANGNQLSDSGRIRTVYCAMTPRCVFLPCSTLRFLSQPHLNKAPNRAHSISSICVVILRGFSRERLPRQLLKSPPILSTHVYSVGHVCIDLIKQNKTKQNRKTMYSKIPCKKYCFSTVLMSSCRLPACYTVLQRVE